MTSVMDPIPRITEPEATVPGAPSRSPPDTRYAPGLGAARTLGWFSLGLGLAELLAPETVAQATGVRNSRLLQLCGLREIACGVGILNSCRPTGWLWTRVAGDAIDLATLGIAALKNDGHGRHTFGAAVAVAGVTALDLASATQLTLAASFEG